MRDPTPPWADKVAQRHGVILCRPGEPAQQVRCVEVQGMSLLLTAALQGPAMPKPGDGCLLQFSDGGGILQLRVTLTAVEPVTQVGVPPLVFRFAVAPDGITHLNRRSAFRVEVTLKGELTLVETDAPGGTAPPNATSSSAPRRLALEREQVICLPKRPCIVQDLSVGGARLLLPPPAPRAGQSARLDLGLTRGEVLRNIAGTVVQGGSGTGRGEFSCFARLRFHPLTGPVESRLARLINQTQLETLRQGVRDRR